MKRQSRKPDLPLAWQTNPVSRSRSSRDERAVRRRARATDIKKEKRTMKTPRPEVRGWGTGKSIGKCKTRERSDFEARARRKKRWWRRSAATPPRGRALAKTQEVGLKTIMGGGGSNLTRTAHLHDEEGSLPPPKKRKQNRIKDTGLEKGEGGEGESSSRIGEGMKTQTSCCSPKAGSAKGWACE